MASGSDWSKFSSLQVCGEGLGVEAFFDLAFNFQPQHEEAVCMVAYRWPIECTPLSFFPPPPLPLHPLPILNPTFSSLYTPTSSSLYTPTSSSLADVPTLTQDTCPPPPVPEPCVWHPNVRARAFLATIVELQLLTLSALCTIFPLQICALHVKRPTSVWHSACPYHSHIKTSVTQPHSMS
jgi:hypothetical protein